MSRAAEQGSAAREGWLSCASRSIVALVVAVAVAVRLVVVAAAVILALAVVAALRLGLVLALVALALGVVVAVRLVVALRLVVVAVAVRLLGLVLGGQLRARDQPLGGVEDADEVLD